MKLKRKYSFNDYFEFSMYVLAIICSVYFFFKGNLGKTLQPILIIFVLILTRVIAKITKIEFFPSLRFSILIFIFITMFLAKEFGFYDVIPKLDKVEHFLSGVILTFVGVSIFKKLSNGEKKCDNLKIMVWFSLFFAIAMAGVWEIYEFTVDRLLGFNCQNNSVLDTMTDIICGTVSACMTSIYIYYSNKNEIK